MITVANVCAVEAQDSESLGGEWRELFGALVSIPTQAMKSPPRNHMIWVNYNEFTTSSLEIIVSKGNHPQMALIQVSELL